MRSIFIDARALRADVRIKFKQLFIQMRAPLLGTLMRLHALLRLKLQGVGARDRFLVLRTEIGARPARRLLRRAGMTKTPPAGNCERADQARSKSSALNT